MLTSKFHKYHSSECVSNQMLEDQSSIIGLYYQTIAFICTGVVYIEMSHNTRLHPLASAQVPLES